jgi:hypothetical protein
MNRRTLVHRSALALVGAVVAAVTAALPSAAVAEAPAAGPATTAVTFEAPDCDGCRLTLVQASETDLWSSKEKKVHDGQVTFRVSKAHTHGMSVAITTPWEGGTGYVTHVAFKYTGKEPGDHVSFSDARHGRKASACWAGTTDDSVSIRLATRRVTVPGYQGPRTPAALVYTSVTQDAMVPMLKTFNGIVGTQDVVFCGPR